MTATTLTVPDISCEHCEHAITSALSPRDGIERVDVDIETKTVHVLYDESRVSVQDMQQILADEDYPVTSVR
jgi:copper chaperone CopZ